MKVSAGEPFRYSMPERWANARCLKVKPLLDFDILPVSASFDGDLPRVRYAVHDTSKKTLEILLRS